jgi:hypothetical protein
MTFYIVGLGGGKFTVSNFEQIGVGSSDSPAKSKEERNHTSLPLTSPSSGRDNMADERVIGSAAETAGAVKNVPSLALALLPRPELLAAGDSWLASGGSGDEVSKAQSTVDAIRDSVDEG